MSNLIVTNPSDRTFVYSGLFQVGSKPANFQFIQDWEFRPNMAEFDIDKIDTAAPIFTKKSDILGTFSFNTKNTIDIYDQTDPPTATSDFTVSFWAIQIAKGDPPVINFVIKAIGLGVGVSTPTDVNYKFTGRIMDVGVTRIRDTGVHEVDVNGEITAIEEVKRGT